MTNSLIAQPVQHCTSIAEVKTSVKSHSLLLVTISSRIHDWLKPISFQNWKINYISFTTGLAQVIIYYYLAW